MNSFNQLMAKWVFKLRKIRQSKTLKSITWSSLTYSSIWNLFYKYHYLFSYVCFPFIEMALRGMTTSKNKNVFFCYQHFNNHFLQLLDEYKI